MASSENDGADVLEEMLSLGSLRAKGASIQSIGDTTVVRVQLTRRRPGSRPVRRTVTAGMDAFSQLAGACGLPKEAVAELRLIWADEVEHVAREVARASGEVLANPEAVELARARVRSARLQRTETERQNLVTSMTALLRSGWTREMLLSSVDEATVREVMET